MATEIEGKEKKIPVFSVQKNNIILKNIFLISTPPPPLPTSSSSCCNSEEKNCIGITKEEKLEEILVVGRHPDCDITLEHPSISRFHLRIHTIPCIQSLFVVDLSSVHGTWVSGKKIEPGIRVELHEGDKLQLGGSTRAYCLHWLPLRHAYDMKNPFLPPLDDSEPVEERAEEIYTDENEDGPCIRDDQTEKPDDCFEGLDLLFSDMNMVALMKKLSTSPLIPEDIKSEFSFEEDEENMIPIGEALQHRELDKENSNLQVNVTPEVPQTFSHAEDPTSPPATSQQRSGVSIWKRRGKSASVHLQTNRTRENCTKSDSGLEMESESNENIVTGSISEDLFAAADSVEEEIFTPDKENCTSDTLSNGAMKEIAQKKKKHELCVNSLVSSIVEEDKEAFTPDKENITPRTYLLKSMKKMEKLEEINHQKTYRSSPLKGAGSIMHGEAGMLMFSDKQNQLSKLLQEKGLVNRASNSLARSEADPLNARQNRVPFQSLLLKSCKANSEDLDQERTTRSSKSVNNVQIKEEVRPFHSSSKGEHKTWIMVVDTACLLNKESRKILDLMQGLQGTSLIIPRIVIRELDSMKRHNNLFRRTTEVHTALQWIEDCMVNAKWWIHVQSTEEDVRTIAPTPRALPLSQFSEEKEKISFGSFPFSPCGSLLDIVSPTTEDHILECALLFRKFRNDVQLVLLSHDVTLKIKAMAEGLRCETAEEFRESLVNPFSERFLWNGSCPRGPTWSYLDDTVLREKYYKSPSRKQSKLGEGSKGLKLILLHNSQYRQISSVS